MGQFCGGGSTQERAIGKVEDIDRRIAELTSMREALGRLIAKCAGACPPKGCAFLHELAQPFEVRDE